MELSERKKSILKAIVDSYIRNGEPVGSKYIASMSETSVSSATVRNEMSELESLGFLEQPHTSAGRVPSALGYRTYIEHLMEKYMLGVEEIRVLNELLSFKLREMGRIMEQASAVISQLTNYTAVSVLKSGSLRAKKFDAIYTNEHEFLLVMLCNDGSIKSRNIILDEPITNDTLSSLLIALNAKLSGVAAEGITLPIILELEQLMGNSRGIVSPVLRIIYEMLESTGDEKFNVSGISKLLTYPEFADVQKAKDVLAIFEKRHTLISTLLEAAPDKTYILIEGSESGITVPDSSFVFRPVSSNGKTIGAVGVIGPKRMDYNKVIANLEYFASRITDELNT